MADNNVADLPKRNAVAAEPAKSLAGTIQQVMSKAITSPTDGKVDFAQGINPVSGDPQQKSAGVADTAKAVSKEEKEEDKEKEEVKETSHEDEKEVKKEAYGSKKESSHEDEKEKEEVKEGEMPQAALDALKKKQDKEDVKEAAEDEKEDDEKKEEDEKEDEKAVKEQAEKEDEKEVKENDEEEDEKEVKKESAEDKVKNLDMKEDVKALTDGENLSEEFKQKAATIFESAVKAKLVEEIEKLESEYETKVNEQVASVKEEIVEKVDAYLNYVVSEWMKDNELAIEKGLRNEITEDFIGGLKSLFESHYIDVPADKYNVIDEQAAEIESLKNKLNESIEQNVELNQRVGQFTRDEILQNVGSDLAETEKEKFKGLAENVEYKDAADFKKKCETIKESYFPRKKAVSEESNTVAHNNELQGSMAAYSAAISKTKSNPYFKK